MTLNPGYPERAKARIPGGASKPWSLLVAAMMVLSLTVATLTASPAHARGTPDGFADLAERLQPAVVNISTTTIMSDRGPEMPQFPPGSPFDEFFKEFFDKRGNGNGNNQNAIPRRATSLGSGFIIDPEGYIVTNNHVIQDAEEITVILYDDTVLKAEVVGRDAKVDVALLKVDTKRKLPSVSFGDSDQARVGDWVMAIGNPFGLGGTVTAGIISAKTRDINAGPYDSFIQTDASINRGNSGGPLFNMDGEVIGINTAIFSPSGGSVGIGFATPANLAKQVLTDLRKYGKTRRGWLGVRIQTVSDEIAESLGLKRTYGALVSSIQDGSPAATAGVQVGDVVLEFNGREIKDMRRLPAIVAETEIGSKVSMEVWRNGERKTLKVTVGELAEEDEQDSEAPAKAAPTAEVGDTAIAALGINVAPLSDASRERFDIPADAKGLVVTDVNAKSQAAEKGLRQGDVIVEANQTALTAPADLTAQATKAKETGRKSLLLLVQNSSGMRFVALPLTE